jgi:enoyl-[acyl-carrier protein] reductase / trans-2-enoyl-CoA reductase (NAD+)
MIIKPRIRGFICTTAHPKGCAANVDSQISHVRSQPHEGGKPKKALIVGASGGYGLASRIVAAFGYGAATLGVSYERPPAENRTATAGWYNNAAFENRARAAGLYARSLDGDAFSDEMKQQVIDLIKSDLGEIDLVVYSLASPVRTHPRTGILHRSHIKPLGETYHVKTLNVERGEVYEVDLEPATDEETAGTVAVMGGEDWEFWIDALREAGVLATGFKTVSYTYIGSEITWPIYWHATLGKAKEDLDRAARAIDERIQPLGGSAWVAALKAVVTQASTAIPVVPLYMTMLLHIMKGAGLHEGCIEQIDRLFRTQLYQDGSMRLDDANRIRLDDLELREDVQAEVKRRWARVNSENLHELADLEGFRTDFLKIFGFGYTGVDYDEDLDPRTIDV